jgi:hypothetical protein
VKKEDALASPELAPGIRHSCSRYCRVAASIHPPTRRVKHRNKTPPRPSDPTPPCCSTPSFPCRPGSPPEPTASHHHHYSRGRARGAVRVRVAGGVRRPDQGAWGCGDGGRVEEGQEGAEHAPVRAGARGGRLRPAWDVRRPWVSARRVGGGEHAGWSVPVVQVR